MAGVGYALRNENRTLFQEKKEYEDCAAAKCKSFSAEDTSVVD